MSESTPSDRTEFAARIMGEHPRIAFYYGAQDPKHLLGDFGIAVVEPGHDHALDQPPVPGQPAAPGPQWLAYLSLVEALPCAPYFHALPQAWRIGENNMWRAWIIDQRPTDWPRFLIEQIARPIWQKGYRGFFLDTVDSYALLDQDRYALAPQRAGLIRAIQGLRDAFPQAAIILNRGFELLPDVHPVVDAVAFESLYLGWDPSARRYQPVSERDRSWLLTQAKRAQSCGLPVISIDYCDPGTPLWRMRNARERIRRHGLVPYLTDHALQQVYPHSRGIARLARNVAAA